MEPHLAKAPGSRRSGSPSVQSDPAITGIGAVSALGIGCEALRVALEAGRSGIRPIANFSTQGFSVALGAEVPGFPREQGVPVAAERGLCARFGLAAAREAWTMARLDQVDVDRRRVALVFGSSLGDTEEGLHIIGEAIADAFSLRGPSITISTACASSTNAVALARDLLLDGTADVVLAGGSDVLTPEVFSGFHALGLLSASPCAPFSQPSGTTLGEGAGFLVLEAPERARARGVEPLALVIGAGLSSDAYHATAPEPSGAGVVRALRAALEDSGLEPNRVGYLNAHGTGTAANDPAEWKAITQVFGSSIAVSSTKGHLGHAQGAAGVLELIATLLCLRDGRIPPTLHFVGPRPRGPVDPVAQQTPRDSTCEVAACSSAAFGGANAVVLVERQASGGARARHVAPPREVVVAGVGFVGPSGLEPDGLDETTARRSAAGGPRRVPPFELAEVAPLLDVRTLDPASCYLIAAAALALRDAGIRLKGPLRDRAGLFVGAVQASPKSHADFRESIRLRGLPRLAATSFTRIVLNASAGSCAMALGLRGPLSNVTIGDGSGLAAVAYATAQLSRSGAAEILVAGGVDELGDDVVDPGRAEGASCLVLADAGALETMGGAPGPSPPASLVRVAGAVLCEPRNAAAAAAEVLARARLGIDDVDALYIDGGERPRGLPEAIPLVDASRIAGHAPAATSVVAAALATRALRRGNARTALVLSSRSRSASVALLLTTRGAAHGS